ncbi:uncharacterized protein LOC107037251 [Diachasma alloeum]|uniref:uncharacterized protein LOC107037251 n=1 Tax=Diachasma alloeum TaxID=454923 RepID=UPI00073841F5|nr:uncharacterized protein LOC107037251 [Diachasma alloeum]
MNGNLDEHRIDKRVNNSSSSINDGAPADKRPRTSDTVNSSNLYPPATISPCLEIRQGDPDLQIVNVNLADTLTPPPETVPRLCEIREEINNLWEEEKRILGEREEAFKLRIKELQSRLAEATKCSIEARGAQTAAESLLSRNRIEMQKKITELMDKNAKLEEVIVQRTAEGTEKLNAAAKRIIELRQKFLKAGSPSQREIYLKTTELQETKIKIQELESEKISLRKVIQDLRPKAERVEELEKKLKLANQTIVNLGGTDMQVEVSGDEVAGCDRQLEDPISIDDEVVNIEQEALGSRLQENGAAVNGQASTAPEYEFFDLTCDVQGGDNETSGWNHTEHTPILVSDDDDESSSSLQLYEGEENGYGGCQDHRIRVGDMYVLPSDPKFFEIDWSKEFGRYSKKKFVCRSCSFKALARGHIEDHAWVKHHRGRFLCPLCPAHIFSTSSRYLITKHVRDAHGGTLGD